MTGGEGERNVKLGVSDFGCQNELCLFEISHLLWLRVLKYYIIFYLTLTEAVQTSVGNLYESLWFIKGIV